MPEIIALTLEGKLERTPQVEKMVSSFSLTQLTRNFIKLRALSGLNGDGFAPAKTSAIQLGLFESSQYQRTFQRIARCLT